MKTVPRIAIIGGGLAGLSAATELARLGHPSTIFEAKSRLGGRAGSFRDPATAALVDACQHVAMGCCTRFLNWCWTVGLGQFLKPQTALHFMTADRRISRFAADPWPAPFHLGRALFSAHYLTPVEKLRIAWGLLQLIRMPSTADPPLHDWLLANRQTARTIDRFWSPVLTSALNEAVDRVGLKYARKVFLDGFLRSRDAWIVHLPTVPLGEFYGDILLTWFAKHRIDVRLNAPVRRIENTHVHLTDGTIVQADRVILAVPFDRVADVIPDSDSAGGLLQGVHQLQPSPITSVHLWTDRPVLSRPHLVLIDCLGHWVFSRPVDHGEHHLQVVVSAARDLRRLGRDGVQQAILQELSTLFPALRSARILRTKVITEVNATFSAVPGVDAFRPDPTTKMPGLFLAGDWTQTGWPATMEGAVISGEQAARAALEGLK